MGELICFEFSPECCTIASCVEFLPIPMESSFCSADHALTVLYEGNRLTEGLLGLRRGI